jgi:hypothetical protein
MKPVGHLWMHSNLCLCERVGEGGGGVRSRLPPGAAPSLQQLGPRRFPHPVFNASSCPSAAVESSGVVPRGSMSVLTATGRGRRTLWSGESVAERPKEMGFWSEEHGRFYWVDDAGEATWESEHWWTEVPWEDDPTKIYYVNEKTGETSWEMPKSMGWIQWHEEL